jgi:hypothetical protein
VIESLELYFARCGRQRGYVVAPNKARALELANLAMGLPSRSASVTRVDCDVLVIDGRRLDAYGGSGG